MGVVESLVGVKQAAVQLGVSRQRVQQLISSGQLPAVKVGPSWQVSYFDIARLQTRHRRRGRPYPPRRAWELLLNATHTGHVEVRRGAAPRDPFWLADLTCRRAQPRLLAALPVALPRIASQLAAAGETAATSHGFTPGSSTRLDGYATATTAEQLIRRYALNPAYGPDVNLVLRVVADDVWPFPTHTMTVPELVAAVDMIEIPFDDRSITAATTIIERYL